VADAMVAARIVPDRQTAFERWRGDNRPGYVPHPRIGLSRGIALIRQAHGVSVLAHAWGRDTESVLTPSVIADLAGHDGLDGIEVDHNDHSMTQRKRLRELAKANRLITTGSSDYHGTGKVNHGLGCNTTPESSYNAVVRLIDSRGGHR
jgi:predicted metal-dependent phosphoesterase TrpH